MLPNFCDSRQGEKKLQSGQFREGRSGYRKQDFFFFLALVGQQCLLHTLSRVQQIAENKLNKFTSHFFLPLRLFHALVKFRRDQRTPVLSRIDPPVM